MLCPRESSAFQRYLACIWGSAGFDNTESSLVGLSLDDTLAPEPAIMLLLSSVRDDRIGKFDFIMKQNVL